MNNLPQRKIQRFGNGATTPLPSIVNTFLRSVEQCNMQRVKYLVQIKNVDPGTKYNQAIRTASKKGYIELVEYLASFPSVDPGAHGNEPIRSASKNGHLDVVQFLASLPTVNPSDCGDDAIQLASYEGHFPVVHFLASLPTVDISANDNKAIKWASLQGYYDITKFLIKEKEIREGKINYKLLDKLDGFPEVHKFEMYTYLVNSVCPIVQSQYEHDLINYLYISNVQA